MLYFKYYVDVYAPMTPFLRYTSSLLPGLRNGAVPTGNEPPFRFYTGTWRCIWLYSIYKLSAVGWNGHGFINCYVNVHAPMTSTRLHSVFPVTGLSNVTTWHPLLSHPVRPRQWCGIIHYYWWTASIKPRLLFSRAGYASWGLSLSSFSYNKTV